MKRSLYGVVLIGLCTCLAGCAESQKVKDMAVRRSSASNLKQIALATFTFQTQEKRYPSSLKDLADKKVIDGTALLYPGHTAAADKSTSDYDSIFDRGGASLTGVTSETPDVPMAWEKQVFSGGGRNVAFFDGRVLFVTEVQFQDLMRQADLFIAKNKPKDKT